MSDDAGRARPTTDPATGGVTPADPVLRPSGAGGPDVAPAPVPAPATPPPSTGPQAEPVVKHSRTSGLWVGLILSALVLLLLLIFILRR
jgi:hypothetical protein